MPINKSAFRRYKVIDQLLRNRMRMYPTMEDIIEACREKLDVDPSPETIQKDIAKDLKVKDDQNIVEFYNSMADGKVSEELLEILNPTFIWNTKEKTIRMISDGLSWSQRD